MISTYIKTVFECRCGARTEYECEFIPEGLIGYYELGRQYNEVSLYVYRQCQDKAFKNGWSKSACPKCTTL